MIQKGLDGAAAGGGCYAELRTKIAECRTDGLFWEESEQMPYNLGTPGFRLSLRLPRHGQARRAPPYQSF